MSEIIATVLFCIPILVVLYIVVFEFLAFCGFLIVGDIDSSIVTK